jgi:hypothetical protein
VFLPPHSSIDQRAVKRFRLALLSPEYPIDDPAPPGVNLTAAAVSQDLVIVAAGLFECVARIGRRSKDCDS